MPPELLENIRTKHVQSALTIGMHLKGASEDTTDLGWLSAVDATRQGTLLGAQKDAFQPQVIFGWVVEERSVGGVRLELLLGPPSLDISIFTLWLHPG